MLAAGSGAATARDSTAAISAHVDDYLGPTFGATELYAGPVAKTAILASAVTGDPSSFGGHDLVADLQSLETADGRYADHTAYGDTSNTFTQALGLIALSRTASKPSVNAVNYLLAQQCSDDGFRMFPGDGACVSDPDATSLAVVALAAVGGQDGAQDAAALHLSAAQEPSGGVVGGSGTSGVNANTTGLAAMAWRSAGRTAEADAAADFLRSVQLGCDAPATVRGAVAYDPQTYAALVAAGSHAVASDQERRATAQALLGLGSAGLATVAIAGVTEGADGCAGPTETSTSTSTSSSTTATTGSTPVATITHTVTATVTQTATSTVTAAPAAVTHTETATATRTVTSSQPATPSASESSSPASTSARAASSSAPSASVSATAAVTPGAAEPGTSTAALVAAGAFVLAGAAGATVILRRGRSH
ncbi:putative LPXTG-motif cell wall anchor domain protein [Nostocoides jenkinsii Ben 74]|uniref:Putative LPXTG-motif cell wall anchor domain protein n=2 Tax=Nostocoides jenkinsii TaxID=330834 RepID=A0A077MCP5_9MICO|nr:putative LPXTG-motif cell wall anchor domain protein [Tetrasphaera jenkinsii Ben 74]